MKVTTLGIKCGRRGCTASAKVAPRIMSTVLLDDPDYLRVTRMRHEAEGH